MAIQHSHQLIFRQSYDNKSSTYTYIIGDPITKEAIIVDTVFELVDRELDVLNRLNLKLKYIVDTHVHADHVSGALQLVKDLSHTDVKMVHLSNSGVYLEEELKDRLLLVNDGHMLKFGERFVKVLETPGHTDSHFALVLDDESLVLTGCSLHVLGCGRTDFQNGSVEDMYDSITNKLYKLPDHCLVYPAHNYKGYTVSSIGEEKQYNPRIPLGQTLEAFTNIMNELHLEKPNMIDIAVPANIKGGVHPHVQYDRSRHHNKQ